jgi:alkanesulfonate monooxygenase SsuD/methylene tetrahydromethanopterin reductase-like flavin-dependent oxidoreductase (luciferase family)
MSPTSTCCPTAALSLGWAPATCARERQLSGLELLADVAGAQPKLKAAVGQQVDVGDIAGRVDYLEHVTKYIREHLGRVPILIAGSGDRVMTLAARYADIVGLTGADVGKGAPDPLAERIDFVRAAAGDRFDGLELNIIITASPTDASGMPDLRMARRFAPELTDEQLLATPGVLSGTPRDIADRLRSLRDSYGVSYFTVQHNQAEYFGKVIAELR